MIDVDARRPMPAFRLGEQPVPVGKPGLQPA